MKPDACEFRRAVCEVVAAIPAGMGATYGRLAQPCPHGGPGAQLCRGGRGHTLPQGGRRFGPYGSVLARPGCCAQGRRCGLSGKRPCRHEALPVGRLGPAAFMSVPPWAVCPSFICFSRGFCVSLRRLSCGNKLGRASRKLNHCSKINHES